MSKYQNGKIYMIKSRETENIYIGSTYCELGRRISLHRSNYKRQLEGKKVSNCSSYELVKFADNYIELVENFPCNNKQELFRREGEVIKNTKNCVNITVSGRTKEEYYKDDKVKERRREYELSRPKEVKEKIKKYKSQWTKDNREDIKNKYNENKDAINEVRRLHMSSDEMKKKKSEQDAKYREKNQEKAPCDICGTVVLVRRLKEHKKFSKSCIKLSESNSTK